MDDVDFYILAYGADAPQEIERQIKAAIDQEATARLERLKVTLKAIELKLNKHRKNETRIQSLDFNSIPLFAVCTRLWVKEKSFVSEGLIIEPIEAQAQTNTLLMIGANDSRGPHPGPWIPIGSPKLSSNLVQLHLSKSCTIGNFDRLNSVWFAVSLIRLLTMHPVRVCAILEKPVQNTPPIYIENTARISPEQVDTGVILGDSAEAKLNKQHLHWMRDNLGSASQMMKEPRYNLAFRTFDKIFSATTRDQVCLQIWTALEILFCPSSRGLTHSLSLLIATLLEDEPKERDKLYQKARTAYGVRSNLVHNGTSIGREELTELCHLAQRCFIATIEMNYIPNPDLLLERWKSRQ